MKRWLRIAAGCLAMLLGIAGLVLPLLPGWLLLAAGMLLLSPEIPVFRHWLQALERRVPMSRTPLHKFREWID